MILLASGVLVLTLATPALAFDVSPSSLTIQAGDTATGSLSSLPISPDGRPACLEAASGTSIYLSTVFSTPCGGTAGWTSQMTVRTIPATPAGTYTIVFQVCTNPGCSMGPDIRNLQPIQTKNWTVVVTAAPVPGETASATPAPVRTVVAPPISTPQASPTPTRSSALRTPVPSVTTPSASRATSPSPTPSPSQSSPVAAAGAPPAGLVLDRSAVKPGQALKVSGIGCLPNAPATVGLAGSVTTTASAGSDGTFQASLVLPSSLPVGRYTVVAQCGTTFSTLVDVVHSRRVSSILLMVLAAILILLGVAVGRVAWGRHRANPGSGTGEG
jgi:hypothetical protein